MEPSGSIVLYNMNHELTKRFEVQVAADRLFYAGNNRLLVKAEELVRCDPETA